MKETINKIGLFNYVLWKLLVNIELILNIPYFILKIIVEIFYFIFDKLDNLFSGSLFIYLSWFSPVRKYYRYLTKKSRGDTNE